MEQSASTLVDGLCMGLPIVASDSGGISDIMGSAGLLVPEGDRNRAPRCARTLRDDERLRVRLARRRKGALPPRVRDSRLRGQDRCCAEPSHALASLERMSVSRSRCRRRSPETPAQRDDRVTTIRPATGVPRLDARELWRYRELAGAFVWRDLKVRYKQTLHRRRSGRSSSRCSRRSSSRSSSGGSPNFPRTTCRIPSSSFAGVLAVDVLRLVAERRRARASWERVARDEGVLPARPAAAVARLVAARRLRARVLGARRDDRLVRHVPSAPRRCSRRFFILLAARHGARRRLCRSRRTSGTATCRYAIPFLIQVWLFLVAGRSTRRRRSEECAGGSVAQPDDRRRRRAFAGRCSTARRRARPVLRHRPVGRRSLLLRPGSSTSGAPSHASRTRSDGTSPSSVEGLSKRYRIGQLQPRLRHAARLVGQASRRLAPRASRGGARDDLGAERRRRSRSSRARSSASSGGTAPASRRCSRSSRGSRRRPTAAPRSAAASAACSRSAPASTPS